MSRRYTNISAELKPLIDGITSGPEKLPSPTWVNVHGRKEHEALLRNPEKMKELGLDPYYEQMVYLKRWGAYLFSDEIKQNRLHVDKLIKKVDKDLDKAKKDTAVLKKADKVQDKKLDKFEHKKHK